MSDSVSKDFFVKILDKISIKQIIFSLLIWIVLYYFLSPHIDVNRLPNVPYIKDEYKASMSLIIFSLFIVFVGIFIYDYSLKVINFFKMEKTIKRLDINEKDRICEFFRDDVNSCSFSISNEEGVLSLIEKGILTPVDKELYSKKQGHSFYFYLHPRARKIFRKLFY
ncbi:MULTISPECIES: super-infection exclusion protein B [unclassified Providencia]|uniref:super-infection exclusion protein B n=1 Tax=unclassified Providencia TaxID=2633465 RepID=UPI00234AF82C|nr:MULTISPECIES: super-infection exclusion protein B [unclassified Providencia]